MKFYYLNYCLLFAGFCVVKNVEVGKEKERGREEMVVVVV